ncbi:MAG: thymidylate synthase [Deltaproteobacteria bacterium]|nr:thymidylate synthase [Deltaproteobacteria bacterium]
MKQYLAAVREVLDHGTRKTNRTGVDTLSKLHVSYDVDVREGFPLLTTKEISWKNIVVENLWFLSGSTNIELLRKHGCKFWDPWADERGDVPSAYGSFWRSFPEPDGSRNDQVAWVLSELARNPDSRRLVINAWAPGHAQRSALPPCHLLFIFNVQRTPQGEPLLCLHLTQRSADLALGVPYNLAGYAFLLELFARISGIRAGIFAHTLVDAHIYTKKQSGEMAEYDHVPGLLEQLSRTPRRLPRLEIDPSIRALDDVKRLLDRSTPELLECFKLIDYDPHPGIRFKVAV